MEIHRPRPIMGHPLTPKGHRMEVKVHARESITLLQVHIPRKQETHIWVIVQPCIGLIQRNQVYQCQGRIRVNNHQGHIRHSNPQGQPRVKHRQGHT